MRRASASFVREPVIRWRLVFGRMLSNTARVALKAGAVQQRCLGASAALVPKAKTLMELTKEQREEHYPLIGNRDIVSSGLNGIPSYVDLPDFPMPGVRWAANTSEVLALREKEKGDWKSLTLEEKKQLYRNSYRQTFAEMTAATGDWKRIVAYCFYGMAAAFGISIFTYWAYPASPGTLTDEYAEKTLKAMLKIQLNDIEGLASTYDYEKGQWKK